MFDPKHLAGASSDLVQSMVKVGRKAAELERVKLQTEIQKEKSEIRRKRLENKLKMSKAGGKGGPAKKKVKPEPEPIDDDDDNFLEDLVTTTETDKGQPSYSTLEPGGFVTKGTDRKSRLDKRHAKIAAAAGKPEEAEGDVEETAQEQLEREADELTSQLKKAERAEAQALEKDQKDKAKRYSQRITSGKFLKKPRAVTLVETKKRKSMKMGDIASAEEEDDPDDIPEGFHLQEESPHCINMTRAEDYQAYLRQIVLEFERLIKSGATNISEEYAKVIQSMFWAVKANKQTILNGADPAEVLASVPDARCKAWKLKLNGKTAIDPTTLVESTEIGPQMASDVVNLKPQEIFEIVEEELVGKSKEQVDVIKKCIGNICREQALAHRHAAEAADNLASLTDLVSLPIVIKVMSATMRPTVAIKIPEVDDMIARAEQKVEAIRQAKQKVGELKAIDEVVFAQNVPKYNPEWEHSPNGRATAYLATLVCRYMHELQQKDKKVVLSAKALETIYHTASSSIGKLISGKQYLGGAALEQLRDKVEAEGKELPFKKKKKLPQRSSGLAKTSGTASKD